jgi:PAS domain S-box-containing protein
MVSKVASLKTDLEERLRFESVLAELSSRFINLEPTEVDREIEEAQRRVCECLELDISALWQLSPEEPEVLRMTHVYRRLSGPPIPDDFDGRQYNPWALGEVFAGRDVLLPNIREAPREAATDCETWRYFDIKSVFCFPLSTGGESAIGCISFHHVRQGCAWSDDIVQRLQLVSQIFANALVRKRSDAALRESEERLKLAAEAAEVGMWMLDVENGRFWATEGARQIFGYSAEIEVTMDVFLNSVHPTCRDPVREAVRRAVEEWREVDIEYRVVLPDGTGRWVHSRGRMQPTSATYPAHLLGVSVDSTERRRSTSISSRSTGSNAGAVASLERALPSHRFSSWSNRSRRPRRLSSSRVRPVPVRS